MTRGIDRTPMTAAEFRAAQAKIGLNNREMAEALEIMGKGREGTIVRYRSGARPLAMRIGLLMRIWSDDACPSHLRPALPESRKP